MNKVDLEEAKGLRVGLAILAGHAVAETYDALISEVESLRNEAKAAQKVFQMFPGMLFAFVGALAELEAKDD